jgi:ACT domain-containing protein
MLNKQQILKVLCDELRQRPIIQFAVKKAGISRAQYYRWIKEDKGFADKVSEAIEEGTAVVNDFSVSKLLTGINNDNLSAVFFWLRARHPDFSNRLQVTTKQEITYTLTDEQKQIIEEALKLSGLTNNERSSLETLLNQNNNEKE